MSMFGTLMRASPRVDKHLHIHRDRMWGKPVFAEDQNIVQLTHAGHTKAAHRLVLNVNP